MNFSKFAVNVASVRSTLTNLPSLLLIRLTTRYGPFWCSRSIGCQMASMPFAIFLICRTSSALIGPLTVRVSTVVQSHCFANSSANVPGSVTCTETVLAYAPVTVTNNNANTDKNAFRFISLVLMVNYFY